MTYTKLSKDEQLVYLYIYSMELEYEDGYLAFSLDDISEGMMLSLIHISEPTRPY